MSHKNDVTPHNDKGQEHGYWKCHYDNDLLWVEGLYLNGKRDGVWKWYYSTANDVRLKLFYI